MSRRWMEDAFAIAGLACMVVWVVYESRAPVPREITHALLFIAAAGCAVIMWAWMFADCVAEVARGRTSRRVFWLGAIFAFFPSAYVYYFLERRRRLATKREGGASKAASLPPDP